MSAFLHTDDHFAAIVTAAYANPCPVWYRNGKAVRLNPSDAGELFRMLKQANIDSVAGRYMEEAEKADARTGWLRLSPIEIIVACNSFDYQACEVQDYEQTDAARTVEAVRARAIRTLPGHDAAAWSIPHGAARFETPSQPAAANAAASFVYPF